MAQEREGGSFKLQERKWIVYPAVFTESEEGKYFAIFPDLPGCFTQGETFNETFFKAQEALAIYLQQNDSEINPPSDITKIQEIEPNRTVQLIAIDANSYIVKSSKIIKKTLTIPDWLNQIAEKHQINFSQVLKKALIEQLKSLDNLSSYDRRMLDD